MTFKHPNLKDTVSKNASHVEYIATRSGVDKTITEADLKNELDKGIEDITKNMSDDESYLKYINERPRSHGLFGADGIEDYKEVQEEITNVSSYVWRSIVSLHEDDAKKLGYTNKEQWQDMLRKKIPDMANSMGIRTTNLRWVAAVHMEKGHPHAHIMLWEKVPEKTIGTVSTKTLDGIRKIFTDEIFEEERFQLMNEKNTMRDLLRDLAKGDISQATKLLKDVRATGLELSSFCNDMNNEGVVPRLYSEEEQILAEKINILCDKMPGKGRIAFKFMPEDTKEEVREIADYLLQQPEMAASLEKNLKAVEELTKMYTGKDEDITKARNNAYNDIRDRICQVILKGTVESQRENTFYVDKELSQKAADSIKNINTQINLIPEQTKVLDEISTALVRTGHSDEQIYKYLSDFIERENISYKGSINNIIKQARESGADNQEVNILSNKKNIDYYLSVLKLSGYKEGESFLTITQTISKDSVELDNRLNKIKDDGYLKKEEEEGEEKYKLTNKGIEEFLKVKELDKTEKEIFKVLENDEKDEDITPVADFKELLNNKDIFSSLYDKDPEEFKLDRYDTKVREVFGDNNSITLKELEEKIYAKYTDEGFNTNTDKADTEIEILEKRIEKLALNGFVKFDRESGIYSFTDGVDDYFRYDEEKDTYFYTNKAKKKLGIKDMEVTKYDAMVTMSYIDRAENGLLTRAELRNMLHKDIVNKTAKRYYESFTSILESGEANKYISISESGDLRSTKEGQALGRKLYKFNKYFYECKGDLTEENLKNMCIKEFGSEANKHFTSIMNDINKLVENGHIDMDIKTGVYKINNVTNDINKLLYQIYKEDGVINKNNLEEVLEKNYPNREAENTFKYLLKRLDNLKSDGYIDVKNNVYSLNEKGMEKREDLLVPQRDILRKKLKYLQRLGLLEKTDGGYQATQKYYKYMKDIAISKENKTTRDSKIISKDIASIIDRTQDKVDVDKIERGNEKIAKGKYINGEFDDIKDDYESMRKYCNVTDTVAKTLNNISTTLLVSGISLDETKKILHEWNTKTNSNIDPERINEIIDKAYENFKENKTWDKTTIISPKEWKEMFGNLGVDEKDIPKWMYKGEDWKSFNHSLTLINDIWKAVWKQLERQRMQTEAQAEFMKKQLNKQQAANQSKEAIKEQIRKNKDRSNFYEDSELEI